MNHDARILIATDKAGIAAAEELLAAWGRWRQRLAPA